VARETEADLSSLGKGDWATYLYGPSREVVGRFAWAMARANDPTPFWLDIRADDGRPDAGTPPALGWINPDQLFIVAPTQAKPELGVDPWTMAQVIRSDEPGSAITDLNDFLRLPSAVQEILGLHTGGGTRSALVIANGDRVRTYWPVEPAGVRPVLDTMLHQGVLPIFTAAPPAGPGRIAFDFVFQIRGIERGDWRSGALHCERAPKDSGFRSGQTIPVAEIGALVSALEARPLTESTRR
jgi:hypothetical protein